MVKTKYLYKVPEGYHVSEHFKLSEFKSPDSQKVQYSTKIIDKLEEIRAEFCGAHGYIKIDSAYRSPAENARVNGARNSAHLTGNAVDFRVFNNERKLVSPKKICLYLEKTHWKWGIGLMHFGTHMDDKFVGNHMDETIKDPSDRNTYYTLSHHGRTFSEYFGITGKYKGVLPAVTVSNKTGSVTAINQWKKFLIWFGYKNITLNGKFDAETHDATVKFQKENHLTPDGSVGEKTRNCAKNIEK